MVFRAWSLCAALTLSACQFQSHDAEHSGEKQSPERAYLEDAIRATASASQQKAGEPAKPMESWLYSSYLDQMSGKQVKTATIKSTNTLNFGFPYGGDQLGTITIRKHPGYGNDVILQIERGQILCHGYAGDCPIKIRFDDGKAFTVNGNNAADSSTEVVFLPGFKSLLAKMSKAKEMRVQFNVYQQGAPVLVFDVDGLDLSRL